MAPVRGSGSGARPGRRFKSMYGVYSSRSKIKLRIESSMKIQYFRNIMMQVI